MTSSEAMPLTIEDANAAAAAEIKWAAARQRREEWLANFLSNRRQAVFGDEPVSDPQLDEE